MFVKYKYKMKRINEYKKLFNVEGEITLKELKTTYRGLVKEWHPDKFQADDEKFAEAEEKSQQIITGYHFLVSIAPETHEANKEEYNTIFNEVGIADYKHKGLLFEITFLDGSTFEFFGVNGNLFTKFHNADKQLRFAKRNIFSVHKFRKSKDATLEN